MRFFGCEGFGCLKVVDWLDVILLGEWLNGLNFLGLGIFSRENMPFKLFFSGSIG